MTPEDFALLRMLRLDGLANGLIVGIVASLDDALGAVAERLAAWTGSDGVFGYARLIAIRTQLQAARLALASSVSDKIDTALDGVIETTPAAVAQQVRAGIPEIADSFAMVPFGQLRAVKDILHDGFSWTRWGERLAEGALARVENELRQSVALGESTRKAAKRIERVTGLGRTSATRLARTAINATANRAQMEQWRDPAVKEYADGWRFTAVLDNRVSLVCASLHGQIFDLDDADAPFPPRHPNCRSSMSLVFKHGRFTREFYQARGSGEDWLRSLPEDQQLEILGPARLQAFRQGMRLGNMVTYDAPLSVADLKRLYPEQFS
jgi:SPP1 gp7 family putative phage head morphogenesis protein